MITFSSTLWVWNALFDLVDLEFMLDSGQVVVGVIPNTPPKCTYKCPTEVLRRHPY